MWSWTRWICFGLACTVVTSVESQVREGEWTLATFNVRYDNPSDPLKWTERRDEVARIVGFYDIVGLQETLPHQVKDVADRLPWMSYVGRYSVFIIHWDYFCFWLAFDFFALLESSPAAVWFFCCIN